jgi:hypothetical protein
MLRITEILETRPEGGAAWALKLEGYVQGEWVKELRRAWRGVRVANAGAPIRVVLADIDFVDESGKALLTEMHREGVDIIATDPLTAAIRDEIVAAADRSVE